MGGGGGMFGVQDDGDDEDLDDSNDDNEPADDSSVRRKKPGSAPGGGGKNAGPPSSGSGGGGMNAGPPSSGGGVGGGMGGGIGGAGGSGMGAGMGGGAAGAMPPTASQAANAVRLSLDDLVLAIPMVVAPETWDEAGGPGTLVPLAGMLIVQQTPPVHRQIERFLQDLREETRTNVSISVDARWLRLATGQPTHRRRQTSPRRGEPR